MSREVPPATAPQPDASAPTPRPLRLSILHLLLWMAGTGIVLAYLRNFPVDQAKSTTIQQVVLQATQLAHAFTGGIAVASLVLLVQHGFRRGGPFPTQPGHWLLLEQGFSHAAAMCVFGVRTQFVSFSSLGMAPNAYALWHLWMYVPAAAAAGCVMVAALSTASERAWRNLFAVRIVVALVWLFLMFAIHRSESFGVLMQALYLGRIAELMATAVLGLWVAAELFRGGRRDWLHYTGLTVVFVDMLNTAIWTFLMPLLYRG